MTFELQQLRHVLALAEHGSFVRAAAALHISQPALSRSIQNLERRLGGDLFLRATGGIVPTDMGRLYIERIRDLLRMADELEGAALGHAGQLTGRVAVGGGTYPAESFLGPAAARLNEEFPRVAVHLLSDNWDELLRRLRSRELDFFVAETSTLGREADLDVAPMPSMHSLYFVGRAGHPLAGQPNVSAMDALEWPFVTPSRIPPRVLDPMLVAQRAATGRSPAPARPFPAIECIGLAPIKRIVASSNALSASILSCIATELEAGKFVLLGTEPWMHLQYGIVSLRGRAWTSAAQRLRELVLEAERDASQEELQLFERFGPRPRVEPRRSSTAARPRRVARRGHKQP